MVRIDLFPAVTQLLVGWGDRHSPITSHIIIIMINAITTLAPDLKNDNDNIELERVILRFK